MGGILSLFLLLSFSIHSSASPAIDVAIKDSGAITSDSIETKTALLLHLLNDLPYLSESSPDPRLKDFAQFSSTSYADATKLISQYKKDSSGSPYAPYDLDSKRTPEQMLEQRIGGSCGTQARTFAELIKKLGIPESDIRIVSAVCTEEYDQICTNGKGSKVDSNYQGGASGHVFVQLKVNGKWKLINTTYAPYLNRVGDHAEELQKVYSERLNIKSKKDADTYQARVLNTIRKLNTSDLEMVDFESPDEISKKLKSGQVVKAPEFESLPETIPAGSNPIHFRKMMIYDISEPSKFPLHTFKERINLIASGKKDSAVCRFTPSAERPSSETKRPASVR